MQRASLIFHTKQRTRPDKGKSLGRVPVCSHGQEGSGPASVVDAVLAVVMKEGPRS